MWYVHVLHPNICRYDGVTGVRTRLAEEQSRAHRLNHGSYIVATPTSRVETCIQCVEILYKNQMSTPSLPFIHIINLQAEHRFTIHHASQHSPFHCRRFRLLCASSSTSICSVWRSRLHGRHDLCLRLHLCSQQRLLLSMSSGHQLSPFCLDLQDFCRPCLNFQGCWRR